MVIMEELDKEWVTLEKVMGQSQAQARAREAALRALSVGGARHNQWRCAR